MPKDHPLRAIREMADEAQTGMDEFFDSMYAPPEIVGSAGEAAEGPIADDPLLHS